MIAGYPEEQLFEEIAFVAYYMHWSEESILGMPHWERRRWCDQISKINQEVSSETRTTRDISLSDIG